MPKTKTHAEKREHMPTHAFSGRTRPESLLKNLAGRKKCVENETNAEHETHINHDGT
jgi:hypothetical protein